jgi:phenylpropionate dioxygenase-like ring-hydroxylating dioxygenase large terminal subunit
MSTLPITRDAAASAQASYLSNAWYAAGWASDLGDALVGRKFLDLPVLLYRNGAGKAIAIGDRCPHRFAPLHCGKKLAETIECGYHGVQFDERGVAVVVPGEKERIAANMRVPSYPLDERDGVLWIWPGTDAPDYGAIPDLSDRLSSPAFCHVTGSMRIRANYELLLDNLIDPSHGQFLHGELLKRDGFFDVPHEVRQEGTTVSSERVIRNTDSPAAYAQWLPDPSVAVDWWTRAQWDPPGVFRLDNGVTPTGSPRENGVRRCGVHLVTPETATSSHYFFAAVRNYQLGDARADEASRTWQHTVFDTQDRPMLEAVQEMMGTTDFASLHPVLVAEDQPAMRIRSTMRRLIERESTVRTAATR